MKRKSELDYRRGFQSTGALMFQTVYGEGKQPGKWVKIVTIRRPIVASVNAKLFNVSRRLLVGRFVQLEKNTRDGGKGGGLKLAHA